MIENDENMAQQSITPEFKPIRNEREKKSIDFKKEIKEKLKNSKFNNTRNWPVYTKYLPSTDPRYTGL